MEQAIAPPAQHGSAARRQTVMQLMLLFAVVVALAAFVGFGVGRGFTLEAVQANEQRLLALREHSPLVFAAAYLLLYVGTTALSVPGAAVLTVAAGALFGLMEGTLLVSIGSAAGATLAFLGARLLFRDLVQRRFSARLRQINRGLQRGGRSYLLKSPVGAGGAVRPGQSAVRGYRLSRPAVLLGQSAWHASGHAGVCERRNAAGPYPQPVRHPVPRRARVPAAACCAAAGGPRRLRSPDGGPMNRAWTCPRRFDRNLVVIGGHRWTGQCAGRREGGRAGDPDRIARDGRRLPEHGPACPARGADPCGAPGRAGAGGGSEWACSPPPVLSIPRQPFATSAPPSKRYSASMIGRAVSRFGCRCAAGGGTDHVPVDGGGGRRSFDHPRHCHRHGGRTRRAPDPRPGSDGPTGRRKPSGACSRHRSAC